MKRHLLLSFAEAGLFSIYWSDQLLDETEGAIKVILNKRDHDAAEDHAREVRRLMNLAFPESTVNANSRLETSIGKLPDENDRHVIATAIKARADIIVTENLKDFPKKVLANFGLKAQASDAFIADMIDLYPDIAMNVVQLLMQRFRLSANTPGVLLDCMERTLLTQSVAQLKQQIASQ